MKLMKSLAPLSVLALLLYFALVINFSTTESRFQCPGEISSKTGLRPVTAYIKIVEWVGLWGDSDAALHWEIPNIYVEYFGHVIKVGDQYQIFDSQKNLKGNFSDLSKKLALSTSNGFFDGVCKSND